jgi:hypothetical protein
MDDPNIEDYNMDWMVGNGNLVNDKTDIFTDTQVPFFRQAAGSQLHHQQYNHDYG